MQDIIANVLQLLLIFIAITVIFHKQNFTIIIYISAFGLIAAVLYALNQAPDVAIAEVAIGSAIIPLIYVISIARQREYIVLDRVDHDLSELTEKNEKIYELLNAFVDAHNLKLNVCSNISGDEYTLTDELNVDLILSYDNDKNIFLIKGKKSSILVSKLKKAARKLSFLEVVALKGGESLD
jgi:putative multicomponent Na+:H+ antiporter subunit B